MNGGFSIKKQLQVNSQHDVVAKTIRENIL